MAAGAQSFREGRYAEAEKQFKAAIKLAEKQERDARLLATSLDSLAAVRIRQEKYGDAAALYRRSLKIWENALGPNHPDLVPALKNLAMLYSNMGMGSEAEPVYQRLISLLEATLGPEHLDVAGWLTELASLYYWRGRLGAGTYYVDVVRVVGLPGGIATLPSSQALFVDPWLVAGEPLDVQRSRQQQANYAKAEPLLRRALAIRERVLGPEHREVALSLQNLATLQRDRGEADESKTLFVRALNILEKVHGPEHPDVAVALESLAVLHHLHQDYSEAEPLYQRALAIREKVLGPEDPFVAQTLTNYADLLRRTGRKSEAEELEKRAKAIQARQK